MNNRMTKLANIYETQKRLYPSNSFQSTFSSLFQKKQTLHPSIARKGYPHKNQPLPRRVKNRRTKQAISAFKFARLNYKKTFLITQIASLITKIDSLIIPVTITKVQIIQQYNHLRQV